tara:strand:+ start:411 stop:743 length:333 start_codon:yes stop_codon:yes gene_type:complete
MTYAAPDKVPYDPWFDPNWKYIPYTEYGHNPLDDMPIATNDRFDMYGSSDCDDAYNPPRPEEEIADNITMHEKMYRIATSRNNPFHVGASENLHADIDYVGGSENVQTNR